MSARNAARRYANALFALAREQDALEPVRADLRQLVDLLDTSPEWRLFVTEPSGAKASRTSAIHHLLTGRTHALSERFTAFLDHKGRLPLLDLVVEEWMLLYDRHLGLLRATIASAAPLAPEQVEAIREHLAGRFGKTIILTPRVDPALIGGLQIFIGDQVFDFSVETQLQLLQKRLTYA
ncbi:MAG TPA: ATP synthase F1 subunit delta [Kiritimatiellia bacterium]|nr:ATP synthase F1 subunit delta [Kiritimatiellia bacterium]HMO99678.1 ATP synthase F1 subunit delta [Kiritimatiellia bacterium]HMP96148.1 ATP synthase F1 subunit delta [Kiritimatiellia bacterium]